MAATLRHRDPITGRYFVTCDCGFVSELMAVDAAASVRHNHTFQCKG